MPIMCLQSNGAGDNGYRQREETSNMRCAVRKSEIQCPINQGLGEDFRGIWNEEKWIAFAWDWLFKWWTLWQAGSIVLKDVQRRAVVWNETSSGNLAWNNKSCTWRPLETTSVSWCKWPYRGWVVITIANKFLQIFVAEVTCVQSIGCSRVQTWAAQGFILWLAGLDVSVEAVVRCSTERESGGGHQQEILGEIYSATPELAFEQLVGNKVLFVKYSPTNELIMGGDKHWRIASHIVFWESEGRDESRVVFA